jgi:hypothetical protein
VNAHLSMSGNLIDSGDLIQHLRTQEGMSHELNKQSLLHSTLFIATSNSSCNDFAFYGRSKFFSLTTSINYRLDVHPSIICTHNSLNVTHTFAQVQAIIL